MVLRALIAASILTACGGRAPARPRTELFGYRATPESDGPPLRVYDDECTPRIRIAGPAEGRWTVVFFDGHRYVVPDLRAERRGEATLLHTAITHARPLAGAGTVELLHDGAVVRVWPVTWRALPADRE